MTNDLYTKKTRYMFPRGSHVTRLHLEIALFSDCIGRKKVVTYLPCYVSAAFLLRTVAHKMAPNKGAHVCICAYPGPEHKNSRAPRHATQSSHVHPARKEKERRAARTAARRRDISATTNLLHRRAQPTYQRPPACLLPSHQRAGGRVPVRLGYRATRSCSACALG